MDLKDYTRNIQFDCIWKDECLEEVRKLLLEYTQSLNTD